MSEETQLAKTEPLAKTEKSDNLPAKVKDVTYFSEAITDIEDEVFCRPNCKFCNHPARAEAEETYDKKNNCAAVERFFNEYYVQHPESVKINHANVIAHIANHYVGQLKAAYLRDYRDKLKNILKYRITQDHRLEELKAVAAERLMSIASNPQLDVIKGTDAVVKLIACISEIEKSQEKLRGEINGTEVVAEKFQSSFIYVINQESDETVKRRLLEALDVFQDKITGGGTA